MIKLIDTHAHYDDEVFDADRRELLNNMSNNGIIGIINCGSDIISSRKSVKMAEEFPLMFAAVGVHPHSASEFTDETYDELKELSSHKKVLAIGEIGLDYHYDFSPRDVQKEVFARQINLAREVKKHVVIHEREACRDNLDILKAENIREVGAVQHCFSGSVETLKIILDMGMYISLGGTVTFKNAVKTLEVAKYVPLDRLMMETDSPYLTPVPHRGKRNNSTYMHFAAEVIASVKGISLEKLSEITTENAVKFYGITI